MRARLDAGTDVATLILFDPAALPAGEVKPRDPDATLKVAAASGKALGYSFASDGGVDFLVLVDEAPESRLDSRKGESLEGSMLQVPSGRLVFTGFEDLCGEGKNSYNPDAFSPKMGGECTIPAGNYHVDAFEVDWGEEVEEKIARSAKRGDQGMETAMGTAMGCVIFCSIMLVPALFFGIWDQMSLDAALKSGMWVLLFELLFWGTMIPLIRHSKSWSRMHELRKEIEAEHPSVVVQLTTAHDIPREFTPALFGEGLRHLKK